MWNYVQCARSKKKRFSLTNLWVKNEKSIKKLSNILLISQGLGYAKRPAQSHRHSCWDRAGRFAYHKPSEFNKVGNNFFMDFSLFALKFIQKKIFEFFFINARCLGVCGNMCKFLKECFFHSWAQPLHKHVGPCMKIVNLSAPLVFLSHLWAFLHSPLVRFSIPPICVLSPSVHFSHTLPTYHNRVVIFIIFYIKL